MPYEASVADELLVDALPEELRHTIDRVARSRTEQAIDDAVTEETERLTDENVILEANAEHATITLQAYKRYHKELMKYVRSHAFASTVTNALNVMGDSPHDAAALQEAIQLVWGLTPDNDGPPLSPEE